MSYPSSEYLNQLRDTLSVYYAVFEKIKPKRLNAIEKAYKGVYDAQWNVQPVIRDIEVSHLLGCNEIVVPHLNAEYDRLAELISFLQNRLKDLKQYGELLTNMKPLIDLLKKDVNSFRNKDLKHLANEYNLEI